MTKTLQPANERNHQPEEADDAEHIHDVKHCESSLASHLFGFAVTHHRRAATSDQIASSIPKGQAP